MKGMESNHRKKWTTLLAGVLIAALLLGAAGGALSFPSNSIQADREARLVSKQLKLLKEIHVLPDETGTYAVSRRLTRCDAAYLLTAFLGAEEEAKNEAAATQKKGTAELPFFDVPYQAAPYVGWLYRRGIMTGVSEHWFGSELMVTQGEFARLLSGAIHGTEAYDSAIFGLYEQITLEQKPLFGRDAVELLCRGLLGIYDRETTERPVIVLEYLRNKGCYILAELRRAGWDLFPRRPDIFELWGNTKILYANQSRMILQIFGDEDETTVSSVRITDLKPVSAYTIRAENEADKEKMNLELFRNEKLGAVFYGGAGLYQLGEDGTLSQLTDRPVHDVLRLADGGWLLISAQQPAFIGQTYGGGDRVLLLSESGELTMLLEGGVEKGLYRFSFVHKEKPGEAGGMEAPKETALPLTLLREAEVGEEFASVTYTLMEPNKLVVSSLNPGNPSGPDSNGGGKTSAEQQRRRKAEYMEKETERLRNLGFLYEETR